MPLSESDTKTIQAFSTIWRESYCYWEWHNQYTFEEGQCDGNDPSEYLTLSEEQMSELHEWIDYALDSDDDVCPEHSYILKHFFENDQMGFYLTNGQFKGAMIHFGFDPVNPREINCNYRIKIRQDYIDEMGGSLKHF